MERQHNLDNNQKIFLVHKKEEGQKQISILLNSDQKIQEQKAIEEQLQKQKLLPNQCLLCGDQVDFQFDQITDCSHCFHKKCLREWKEFNFKCPTCDEYFDKQRELQEAYAISKKLKEKMRQQDQFILEVSLPQYYVRSLTQEEGESYQQVEYQYEKEEQYEEHLNLMEIKNKI